MAGGLAFPAPRLTEIDLVVLCLGADLTSEARMLLGTVLPIVTRWCTEQNLQLRVHPRWPVDAPQGNDDWSDDFTDTPVGRLRDLIGDEVVFVFAIIGPDMPEADVALLKFLWKKRPGLDSRVRYVFLPRPGGDAEAVRSLFTELWQGAHVYFNQDSRLEHEFIEWIGEGLGLRFTAYSRPAPAALPAPVVDENVQFTVYRPNAVQPEIWYPLLAFAHLAERRADAPPTQPDPLEQVRALAAQVLGDEAAYGAPRVDARGGVPREGQLTFVPFVEGVDFNPRSQTFEWREDVHQQNFRLMARSSTSGRVLRGQLTVYLGAFILADIDLTFRVEIAAPPPPAPTVRPATFLATSSASPTSPQPELTPVTADPYQKVFPSYSHKDQAIVRQAEAYGKALGHVYLRDRLALRSGEEWEARLLELIDEADIFQLFWSSNSMRSEYVRREWEHALALHRRAFIRPTYWEVPMPHSANPRLPPDELAELHFHAFVEELDSGQHKWQAGGPVTAQVGQGDTGVIFAYPFDDRDRPSVPPTDASRPRYPAASVEPAARVERPPSVRLSPTRSSRMRRLWLIVIVLAVLVALVWLVVLLRT